MLFSFSKTGYKSKLLGGFVGVLLPGAAAQIRFEEFLECFATAMDERFGGGHRAIEDFGYVLVGMFLAAAEQYGGALFFGENGKGFFDLFGELGLKQRIGGNEILHVRDLPARPFVFIERGL